MSFSVTLSCPNNMFFPCHKKIVAASKLATTWLRGKDLNQRPPGYRFAPPCGARKNLQAYASLDFFDRCGICPPPSSAPGSGGGQTPTSHARRPHSPMNIRSSLRLQIAKASAHPKRKTKSKPSAAGSIWRRRSKGAERMVLSIPREIESAGAKRTLLRRGCGGRI